MGIPRINKCWITEDGNRRNERYNISIRSDNFDIEFPAITRLLTVKTGIKKNFDECSFDEKEWVTVIYGLDIHDLEIICDAILNEIRERWSRLDDNN